MKPALAKITNITSYRVIYGDTDSDDCHLASGSTKHACIDRAGRVSRMPKIFEETLAAAG